METILSRRLEESGLDNADGEELQLRYYENPQSKLQVPLDVPGFLIPYFDMDGSVLDFWRFRYLGATRTGFAALTDAKSLRYVQPKDSVNEPYLPPLLDWVALANDTRQPVVITEGELKAACACKVGVPTIGLGGVWCFRSAKQGYSLLPLLAEFEWAGRPVYIVFDSDRATNPNVQAAENMLATELSRRGAIPFIGRLPHGEAKIGIDDLVVAEGPQALAKVLDAAVPFSGFRELFRLNSEVVYVRELGSVVELSTRRIMTPSAFVNHAYATRVQPMIVDGKPKDKPAAAEWIKWPMRNEADRFVYEPGKPTFTPEGNLNSWLGLAVQPAPSSSVELWHELLDHIFGDDDASRRWFEQWLAYPLQHPGTKLFSGCFLWGRTHGTGKSLIGYTMGRIYGKNFAEISDSSLESNNNAWMERRQLVMIDDLSNKDRYHLTEVLKRLITSRQILINEKYIPMYYIDDVVNYLMTSNYPDAIVLEDEDRRFFVFQILSGRMHPELVKEYDEALWHCDLPAAVLHHLMNLDLGDFNPHAPAPSTTAKDLTIELGRSDAAGWVADMVDDPDTWLRCNQKMLPFCLWRSEDLLAIYDPLGNKKLTANGMSREMTKAGVPRALEGRQIPTENGHYRLWVVRDAERIAKMTPQQIGALYDAERKSG